MDDEEYYCSYYGCKNTVKGNGGQDAPEYCEEHEKERRALVENNDPVGLAKFWKQAVGY